MERSEIEAKVRNFMIEDLEIDAEKLRVVCSRV